MLYMASKLSGFNKPVRRSPREHIRDGVCLAALRAFTGVELYREKRRKLTLSEVALRVGSNVHYIRAALVLFQHGDQDLIDRVLTGKCLILAAAARVTPLVRLLAAFRSASPKTLESFHNITGTVDLSTTEKRTAAAGRFTPEIWWEDVVLPSLANGH
jgi:hypothetical protein